METNNQPSGGSPPSKPWERAGSSSGPAPFKPSSPGSTSDVVEGSGTANPGEVVPNANRNSSAVNVNNSIGRPVPARPWEQQTQGNTYGGYGSTMNYNSTGYGTGTYGGSYGGLGGSYGGGGLYGNSMYRGGYGGLSAGSGGMYGGGMYGGGLGGMGGMGGMGGYGMGMGAGGPYGEQDPNNPFNAPPSTPPAFWISLMHVMHGVVTFFGRFSMLIDQNTQAFHMFMSALLQLFDRSGLLYGEIAGFALRILGVKRKQKQVHPPGQPGLPGPQNPHAGQNYLEGPKAAPSGGWDNVWGNN